ncbi:MULTISPECIES: low affinity iron permease family protein [Hymenobacter]|uniref:Low affinity iron permease family protein n=1 Tax=Hymenobacter jejuensis TaxID=2502781 RepID=A0A5B8A4G7_9BACT|nr:MULTISPECIES: low affinity iron permease family protein [Hymenobacter]MBC6989465.1 low affinity iron permease family protein [Hymenobacter sp. BT491]QDA61493.1 low affinity iron permease family protein [Hymenobacter jejuensis]
MQQLLKEERTENKTGTFSSAIGRFAEQITKFSGSTLAFSLATLLVLVWAVTGPVFKYSETWQLVINTGTTIITFLMVFLIQRAQNKDSLVLHLKLNELLAATQGASNRLINAQDFTEEEINTLHQYFCLLAEKAKADKDLGHTHSVEEAEENHEKKRKAHFPAEASK